MNLKPLVHVEMKKLELILLLKVKKKILKLKILKMIKGKIHHLTINNRMYQLLNLISEKGN
jgi:hypothetical protein